jgi:hypothetical protein
MAVNPASTNGLTCLPKHGGARYNKILVTHPMTHLYERLKLYKGIVPNYLVWCPGQNKRIALSFFHGCFKRRLKDYQHLHLR